SPGGQRGEPAGTAGKPAGLLASAQRRCTQRRCAPAQRRRQPRHRRPAAELIRCCTQRGPPRGCAHSPGTNEAETAVDIVLVTFVGGFILATLIFWPLLRRSQRRSRAARRAARALRRTRCRPRTAARAARGCNESSA